MVPRDVLLLFIGYKYKYRNVLSFVSAEGQGSAQSDIFYLSKDPNQIANISIRPVAHPQILSKFFGYVNEIYPHNKSRQSDLALKIFWVTEHGWLWLCTTVDIGITVTN